MAPPFRSGKSDPDSWHRNAYALNDDIEVQYELLHEGTVIKPGTLIKFKNVRGDFKFRCLAHNIKQDVTWIDALGIYDGAMYSYPVSKLKGVKPKPRLRRIRKKTNA